jgi:hypothetical protein
MCATEENPSVARKQVCRRTLGITKAEKPQSPKSKFKSVTPKKSFFLFSTSDLPRAINKIAGQQWVFLFFTAFGPKQYPRKSNLVFGYLPLRFASLQ